VAWALTQWSVDPVPVIGCALAALLYARGRSATPRSRRAPATTALCFWTGLVLLLAALISPLDGLDLRWQWVHMTQHVLLLLAAPPLLLLGDAFGTVWRGVQALGSGDATPPRALHQALWWLRTRRLGSLLVLTAFCVDLLLWHLPALYNLTLANQGVHDTEHLCFLVTGLLFWDQVVTRFHESCRLTLGWRASLLLAGMTVSWALAVVIGYASQPLYAYPTPGTGLSALQDQQIAAGIMWVPGSIPFVAGLIWVVIEWFESDARADAVNLSAR
jgi:putative membrane protein